jgi:branched-chain amino acid transport system ATP-binding protein
MNSFLELNSVISGSWNRPISLTMKKSEIVTIIGRNGAGKTTLLNTIAGLIPVSSGEIYINGKNITLYDEIGRINNGIRIALEGRQLFNRLTVDKHFFLGAYREKNSYSKILEKKNWVLDIFPNLREKLNEKAENLSGGQQTQVNIARALIGRPQVLLLDETSLGLDPNNVKALVETLKLINKEEKVTLIIVEQNATMIREFKERIIIMSNGFITFDGSLENARSSGKLSNFIPS